jgi:hypothetical protein
VDNSGSMATADGREIVEVGGRHREVSASRASRCRSEGGEKDERAGAPTQGSYTSLSGGDSPNPPCGWRERGRSGANATHPFAHATTSA